jgi:hypothetical protein
LRFTVRRPASAEVSRCCRRPSGGDVACGVDVGVARAPAAGDALEDRLALTVFRRDMPTVGASLRRVRRRDRFKPPRGLQLQPGHQQSPPLAADLTVEAPFLRDVSPRTFTTPARRAGHRTLRHIGGGLLHPVTAPIGFARAQPRNRPLRSCSPVRSASRPAQTVLQSPQPLDLTNTKARNPQQLPARPRNRDRHPAMHTHDAATAGSRDRFRDGRKSDVPALRSIQTDAVGLRRGGDVAGPPKPHPPDLRYPYLPVAAQPLDMAQFEPDLPKSLVRAGLTPRRVPVGAVKKLRITWAKSRNACCRTVCDPAASQSYSARDRGQLGTLLVVAGRLAARLPVPLPLDRQIPHKPGMTTVSGQRCRLLRTGKQPKPAHSDNLGPTTDNLPKGGMRRFLPLPKPGVSTPQIR